MEPYHQGSIGAYTALAWKTAAKRVKSTMPVDINPDVVVYLPAAPCRTGGFPVRHAPGVVGFFGASSIERLATERAIEQQARKFKTMTLD